MTFTDTHTEPERLISPASLSVLAEPIWSYQRSNVTSPPSAVLLMDVIWQPRTCERKQGPTYHVGS